MKIVHLCVAFAAFVLGLAFMPTNAHAATNISACGILSTPSETYNLTTNIGSGGDCLIIRGDDIVVNLASSTVNGNIMGTGSTTSTVHRQGYRFTVQNGTVTGNISSRGADGRHGGNGGNGSNGQPSVDQGGSGAGGAGGSAATNGNGTLNSVGFVGDDAFADSIGGTGGWGAVGGTGEAGGSGANITISGVIVGGNVDTGGGNGGNGGMGGNGGNGGNLNGNGGGGGDGGAGGDGGTGRAATIINSRIVGTLTTSSGSSGNGGLGGNGGNAEPTSSSALAGQAGTGGSRGGTVPASGLFSLQDSTVVGLVRTIPGTCGTNGASGSPGTALDPLNVPATATNGASCGGASLDPSGAYTVIDNPPFSGSLIGSANLEMLMGGTFNDPGATGLHG